MSQPRAELLARIRTYCQAPPQCVLFDEPSGEFFDVPSAKSLRLRQADISGVETRQDTTHRAAYLLLTCGDSRQVALTENGIAFAPLFTHTGPLELPPAVCFRDYRGLLDRVRHDVYGHPDISPTRQTVSLLMMCVAILEGAKAVGFDIGREEAEVEAALKEVERRAP